MNYLLVSLINFSKQFIFYILSPFWVFGYFTSFMRAQVNFLKFKISFFLNKCFIDFKNFEYFLNEEEYYWKSYKNIIVNNYGFFWLILTYFFEKTLKNLLKDQVEFILKKFNFFKSVFFRTENFQCFYGHHSFYQISYQPN